jgi:hypothetical protein
VADQYPVKSIEPRFVVETVFQRTKTANRKIDITRPTDSQLAVLEFVVFKYYL